MTALVLCGGFAWVAAHRMSKPLERTVAVMEQVAAGDYSQRIDIRSQGRDRPDGGGDQHGGRGRRSGA